MRAGIIILNIFAFVWLAAAIGVLGLPRWLVALPFVLSVAIAWWCLARVREMTAPPPETARDIRRIVGLWSAAEAVLIAIAVIVLVRLGRPELIAPAVAAIVGLHFIPLAWELGVRPYYWTGAGLVIVGIAALALPFRPTLAIAGIGAAAVLYASSLVLPESSGTVRT